MVYVLVFVFAAFSAGLAACNVSSALAKDINTLQMVPFAAMQHKQVSASGVWRPAPGSSWQLQLSGVVDVSFDVTMYDIDLFETNIETISQLQRDGRRVICYFSAGSWEPYRPDSDLFSPELLGEPLAGWEDERWVDIRNMDKLGPILESRMDLAVSKGCDGIDPDNVQAYMEKSGFPLTGDDQLRFNIWLAAAAHERGLSIGLKNDLAQIPELVDYYDWTLNEECFQYGECDALLLFVRKGKAVFGVEYQGEPSDFCGQANAYNFDWLLKNIQLDSWRHSCR